MEPSFSKNGKKWARPGVEAAEPSGNIAALAAPAAGGAPYAFADFRIVQEIHRSASGAVYKAQHRGTGQRVVLKEKRAPEMGPGKPLDSEALLLGAMSHPNVVRCFGSFFDAGRRSLFMVLEDASGGDLQAFVKRRAAARQPLSEEGVLGLFVQIARGVEHLHGRNIVHRDIKALNVVLDGSGVPKVCDLGVSRLRSDETVFLDSFHGTPLYLSPELVDNEAYTEKTDVWSLGVLLYQLAALRLPFEGGSLGQIVAQIKSGRYSPLPSSFSRHLAKLLTAMLHRKPDHRPTLPEVVAYCEQLQAHLARQAGRQAGGQAQRQPDAPAREAAAGAATRGGAEGGGTAGGEGGGGPQQARPQQATAPPPSAAPPQPHGAGVEAAGGSGAAGAERGSAQRLAGGDGAQSAFERGGDGSQGGPGSGAAPERPPSGASGTEEAEDGGGGAALRPAESARQRLLAQRGEERRQRLARGPRPASSAGASTAASSKPGTPAGSEADSAGGLSAGGERDLYALAARMHRLQLEVALWQGPPRPRSAASGSQPDEPPPPLPTPPARGGGGGGRSAGSGSSSSRLSRRSYNIFTHQWEERTIGPGPRC